MRSEKGICGVPTFVYHVSSVRNTGSPTGRESYGDRVLVVVGGVTPTQGDGRAVRRAKQDREMSCVGVSVRCVEMPLLKLTR